MIYEEFPAPKEFKDIIMNFWVFEVDDKEKSNIPFNHKTIPDNCVSIVFIDQPYYQGVRIIGPHTKKYQQTIFPKSTFFGIKIYPWISFNPPLFNKQQIINTTSETEGILSEYLNLLFFTSAQNKLFDQSLIKSKLVELFTNIEIKQNDLIKFICLELSVGKPISTIVNEMPFSVRVIQKMFKRVVGLTMKQYANNLRIREILKELLNTQEYNLDVILKHKYFDQAHFINDFKNKMDCPHNDYESYLKSIKISLI